NRFVSKEPVEDEQILRGVSLCCLQQDRAVSKEHVGLAVEHPLNTGVIILYHHYTGIDLELLEATGEPWLARGPLDHCKGLLFQKGQRRGAPPNRMGKRRGARQEIAQRCRRIGAKQCPDPPWKNRYR